MCPPAIAAAAGAVSSMSASTMFAVSLGLSAVQGVVGYMGQKQAAEAQAEAQVANIRATRNAAATDMVHQTADLHVREGQERAATALRIQDARKQSAQAASTARATSESAGLSFDMLTADYERQYASFADSQLSQLGWNLDQFERQKEGMQASAQGKVNSVPRSPITQPNMFGAIAGVASAGFDAYDRFTIRDPITGVRSFG